MSTQRGYEIEWRVILTDAIWELGRDHTLESLSFHHLFHSGVLLTITHTALEAHCRYKAASERAMGVSIPPSVCLTINAQFRVIITSITKVLEERDEGKRGMNDRFFISSPLFLSFPYFTRALFLPLFLIVRLMPCIWKSADGLLEVK